MLSWETGLTLRKLLWHNPHLQFVKLFNWLGKAENSSLKASHCSCLTLPCCVRTGECSFLLGPPNFREVQYQETVNLWVLTFPEVWQSWRQLCLREGRDGAAHSSLQGRLVAVQPVLLLWRLPSSVKLQPYIQIKSLNLQFFRL